MNLKAIRTTLELTQVQAAAIAGVNSITWSRWERGVSRPTPRAAATVALMERAAATPTCHFSPRLRHTPGLAQESHITTCPRCQVARTWEVNRGI